MTIRHDIRVLGLTAALFLLGPWQRPAAAQLLGPEFQVNTYTTGFQNFPAVATDDAGNFVVIWESYSYPIGSGGYEDILGQRFDAAGSPVGSEFQVNSYTTGPQRYPAVAADGPGNFLVVWNSGGQDTSDYGVFGQRYDAAGNPAGNEFRVNAYTTGSQFATGVAADGAGNFVVTWQSSVQDDAGYGVFGQRYDSAGGALGSEFQINSFTTGLQFGTAVAADGSGNFLVVWISAGQDGSSDGLFGQRYDSSGDPAGSEFRVNSYTTGVQRFPAVAADGVDNFVVAWRSQGQDLSGNGVFGQRFSITSGSAVGSEFPVNSFTTGNQQNPAVTADGAGNFVVVWQSDGQDLSNWGAFGQRFDAAGGKVESEIQVNAYTTSDQRVPKVAADGAGNFVATWASLDQTEGWDVFQRQLTVVIFEEAAAAFEDGSACGWDVVVGSSEVCPPPE